jgi:protein-S-isoprenylcysteine O-methyltransferase Ste14
MLEPDSREFSAGTVAGILTLLDRAGIVAETVNRDRDSAHLLRTRPKGDLSVGQKAANTPEDGNVSRKAAVRVWGAWIVLPLFFLVVGGSLEWWEAWIYCVLLLVPMTAFVTWMVRHDPAFLARRFKLREKERIQHRIQAWGFPFILATLIIPGLDRRFGWSEPPAATVVTALILSLGGYLIILMVFLENRWAGRTVETFSEQHVVSTGPYALVRHPMYSGIIILLLATPVALGSWWALLSALAFIPFIVLRIRNEEEVLARELPGYEEYRRRVIRRLVPFLW